MTHANPADRTASMDSRSTSTDCERRQFTRYAITRPVLSVPVQAGGRPARQHPAEGLLIDISHGGLLFEIPASATLESMSGIVGIELGNGQTQFATFAVCHTSSLGDRLRLGARFVSPAEDVLSEQRLLPRLQPGVWTFETGLPPEVIRRWVDLGIVRPVVADRVFVCPRCGALPTSRRGCPVCGSGHLEQHALVHHFRCAYVGHLAEFDVGGQVVCPKCQARPLVVGADYEHVSGPHRCRTCGWCGSILAQVGKCLNCQARFPFTEACEKELIGYHVDRLDPLALIGAS